MNSRALSHVSHVVIIAIAIALTACKSLGTLTVTETPTANLLEGGLIPTTVSITPATTSTSAQDKTRVQLSLTPTHTTTQQNLGTATPLKPTVPPTFIAVLPSISPSECLLTPEREASRLLGLWFRWRGAGHETEYEKLYFRDDHEVSIWLGGYASGIGNIEPLILDGTYTYDNAKHISLSVSGRIYASLDYNVCGDLLAAYDAAYARNGVYSYIRIAEWCWDIPDAYPESCYPKH